MSTPNVTLRRKAMVMMDEALRTDEGLSFEVNGIEMNSIRSLCYAVRDQDRMFNDGESRYDYLSFHPEFRDNQLRLLIRKHDLPLRARTKRTRRRLA